MYSLAGIIFPKSIIYRPLPKPILLRQGNYIGTVKEIQEKGFLVDRSEQHFEDLFVPYWVCLNDGAGQIRMEIGQGEVNDNVWRTPRE
jgi:hypothetical protein